MVLKRNNAEPAESACFTKDGKLRSTRGQTPAAYQKYKQAIEACDNFDYIEYNVSQIARRFGLDGTRKHRSGAGGYESEAGFRA